MAGETNIQWCDSTVNPIMGCGGCELFPSPGDVLRAVDEAATAVDTSWRLGTAKRLYRDLVQAAYDAVEDPKPSHKRAVTTTNIWHLRHKFESVVRETQGPGAACAAVSAIERETTCYAAKLHLNKGLKIVEPGYLGKKGYAPTFETVTTFPDRVWQAADLSDLLGKRDPDRPWIEGLPRLIFVSDMGDAFSRNKDFPFLKEEVIAPIQSDAGRRHLWLWLTKQPKRMAEFADEIGGFPDNVCAMTTVTTEDSLWRLDKLRKVKTAMRGVSFEPLLREFPVNKINLKGIDWVIAGGESGGTIENARPFPIEWAEALRDHCAQKGVAFFLKQLGRHPTRDGQRVKLEHSHGGNWDEWPDEALRVRQFPESFHEYREYRNEERVDSREFRRPRKGGLTAGEAADFKRLDKVVGKFARDTILAADALFEIRDRRLYRAKSRTFSDYCQSVHEMSRQYANRLIKAGKIRAEMVPIVSKMGLPEPRNEAQLRELSRLGDTQSRVDAYREACEEAEADSGAVTAKKLAVIVAERCGTAVLRTRKTPTPTQRLAEARSALEDLEEALESGEEIETFVQRLRDLLGTQS